MISTEHDIATVSLCYVLTNIYFEDLLRNGCNFILYSMLLLTILL
jgi:hypothetical protein